MAYIYLLDLYKTIDLGLDKIDGLLAEKNQTPDQIMFLKGRKDALLEFKTFLARNLNEKLPKRIRNQLSVQKM